MAGYQDGKGISPDRLADGVRRAGRAESFCEFGEGDGLAARDGAGVLVDAAIERRRAVHIEDHIGEIAGFPAQQCGDAVDRDFDHRRRGEIAGVGILAQHAPPGLDLARFRKLHAENPGPAPCNAASADCRIEYAVSAPRHSVPPPRRHHSTVIDGRTLKNAD